MVISAILCEKCKFSDKCMDLVPCNKFEPEQSSNFVLDSTLFKLRYEKEEFSYS